MDYRQGQCSSCGAEYKIPASFQHDAAKCKECGGVVHIGPVTSGRSGKPAAPAASIPARQFAGKRPEEPARPVEKPAEKKRGTLERLKAERAAAAAGPVRPKVAGSASERLSGAKTPGSKTPVGAAATPRGKAASPTTGVARPIGAPRRSGGGRRRRGGDDDGEAGGRGARGRHGAARRQKQPSMALFAGAAVLLILAGAGAWFLFLRDGDSGAQAAETAQQGPAGGADAQPMDEPAADDRIDDGTAGVEDAAPPAERADAEPADEDAPAQEPKKEAPKGDPSAVDLGAYPDFGPPPGTTAEEWAEMEESVQLFLADEGARSMRALRSLEEAGAQAVPAILNGMKTLDLGTEDGEKMGYALQKALTNIAHGSNYGWYEGTGDTPHYQNKRVVENWIKRWVEAGISIEAWIRFANLEERAPEEAARLRETFVAEGAAVEDDGDLDLDVD